MIGTPFERFWAKVDKPETGCWEWCGAIAGSGYGCFSVNGKLVTAHRWIYEQEHKTTLPPDMFVCHTCDNPKCVRLSHLFAGSKSDNMKDCADKGRNPMQVSPQKSYFYGRRGIQPRGEDQGNSKLTAEHIEQIRMMSDRGHSSSEIADVFQVTSAHIRKIVSRRSWNHV